MTTDLLEILPAGKRVKIGRGEVEVCGISLNDTGVLIRRFPELVGGLLGGTMTADLILREVPEAFPALLAAGIGRAGDEKAEQQLGRLPAIQQLTLLDEILSETMGGESGPFVDRFKAIAKRVGFDFDKMSVSPGDSQEGASSPEASVTSFRLRSKPSARTGT